MATRKIKPKTSFTLNGVNYTDIPYYNWGNNVNEISIGKVGTAKMIRQYIAQKYPKYYPHTWVQAGTGSSNAIDVYFNRIPSEAYEELSHVLEGFFKEGYFDGMTDTYMFTKKSEKTDDGRDIRYGAMYVFFRNQPPYGAKEANEPPPNFTSTPSPTTTTPSVVKKSVRGYKSKPIEGDEVFSCAGWDMLRVKVNVKGVEKQVYKLKKKKETPTNREKWDEIKGVMMTKYGLKWNKFSQSFDRFLEDMTFPNQTELCDTLNQYYGGTTPAPAEPEPTPSPTSAITTGVFYDLMGGVDKDKAWLVYKREAQSSGLHDLYLWNVEKNNFGTYWKTINQAQYFDMVVDTNNKGGEIFSINEDDAKIAALAGFAYKFVSALYVKNVNPNYDINADPNNFNNVYVGIRPYPRDATRKIRLHYARIRYAEGVVEYADKFPKYWGGPTALIQASEFIGQNMVKPLGGYDKHRVDWMWLDGSWGEARWDITKDNFDMLNNFWAYETIMDRFDTTMELWKQKDWDGLKEYVEKWSNWFKERDLEDIGISKDTFEMYMDRYSSSVDYQTFYNQSKDAIRNLLLAYWGDFITYLQKLNGGEPSGVEQTKESKIKAYQVLLRGTTDPAEKQRIEKIIKAYNLI